MTTTHIQNEKWEKLAGEKRDGHNNNNNEKKMEATEKQKQKTKMIWSQALLENSVSWSKIAARIGGQNNLR